MTEVELRYKDDTRVSKKLWKDSARSWLWVRKINGNKYIIWVGRHTDMMVSCIFSHIRMFSAAFMGQMGATTKKRHFKLKIFTA